MALGLKAGRPSAQHKAASLSDLKPESVRLNVDIDKALHKKLKLHAVEQDRSVADVVRDILQETLDKA